MPVVRLRRVSSGALQPPSAGDHCGAFRAPVAVAADGDHVAVVEQAIQDRGGHHRVAEHGAPLGPGEFDPEGLRHPSSPSPKSCVKPGPELGCSPADKALTCNPDHPVGAGQKMAIQKNDFPNPGDSDTERWVWDEVRAKRVADLHARCNEQLDVRKGRGSRSHDERRWISAAFIERILTEEPWRDALPHYGLRIRGALVTEPLNLSMARIAASLELNKSRFESTVSLIYTEVQLPVSLDGCTFEEGIEAAGLQCGSSLFLRNGAVVRSGALNLHGANIQGHLELINSTFEKGIQATDLRVGGNFALWGGAALHPERARRGAHPHPRRDRGTARRERTAAARPRAGGSVRLALTRRKPGPSTLPAARRGCRAAVILVSFSRSMILSSRRRLPGQRRRSPARASKGGAYGVG